MYCISEQFLNDTPNMICCNLQYTSLLRPPILESAAPGAELINKVEWKQVSALFIYLYDRIKKLLPITPLLCKT